MAEIGHIKTVRTDDDRIELDIMTGSGPVVTAELLGMAGGRFHPMEGDPVAFVRAGQEIHVVSVSGGEQSTNPGEVMLFSRNAAGGVAVTVHITNEGKMTVGNGTSPVSLSQKVDALFTAIQTACSSFTGPPNGTPDGGVTLAGVIATALASIDTASSNLEAD